MQAGCAHAFEALVHQLQQLQEWHRPSVQHLLPCSLHSQRDLDSQRVHSDGFLFGTQRAKY